VLTRGSKKVIIDYSHTAGSLEQALINLRRLTSEGQKIYTVFGCGGDRDKTKRPVMGEIAARLSDVAIVTSDNPRTEDPLVIIEEIKTGMKTGTVLVEPDREQAIKLAVFESEDDAVILIAGKGHEDYQVIGTEKQHFSDKEIAEKFLRESVV
jgi:UDP-N-acetylmuramoyl-L-alanyl-D-glutamate--2,6-diaminopimelate ligase